MINKDQPNKTIFSKKKKKKKILKVVRCMKEEKKYKPGKMKWPRYQHQPPSIPSGPIHVSTTTNSLKFQFFIIIIFLNEGCLLHTERATCLIRWGSLMRQRALQRGSLMTAPCLSSCVANPPSTTAQPPAFSIKSSNEDLSFPISLSLSLQRFFFFNF